MKKRINITLDDKSLFIVDHMAEDRGIDRSSMITLLIRLYDEKTFNNYSEEYEIGKE